MFAWFGTEARRKRFSKSLEPSRLKDFLDCRWPGEDAPISQVNLVAVDFETTGLNIKSDQIISIGYVHIRDFNIDLSSANHLLIKSSNNLPEQTVVIHKITDDQISTGTNLDEALDQFLVELKGKVLVAHHGIIESQFLNEACKRIYGSGIVLPVIDTLELETKILPAHQHHSHNLNLNQCCSRYNLPRYKLHDALCDALSCAELLLAQLAHRQDIESLKLGQLVRYLP